MATEVTDPQLLAQLNGPQEVTDPQLLAQLNGTPPPQPSAGPLAGVGDAALTMGSGALKSITGAVNDLLPEAFGGTGTRAAMQHDIDTDPVLNYQPHTAEGQSIINTAGAVMHPVAAGLQYAHSLIANGFGDRAADVVGDVATIAGARYGAGKDAPATAAETAAATTTNTARTMLQNENVPLNMAQATGSKLAQHVDRASQMLTTGAASFAEKQGRAYNSAVLRRIGETDADAATPEVLQGARERIGGVMDDVASRANVQLDQPLAQSIKDITDTLPGRVPASEQAPLLQNIQDMTDAATANGGAIPGPVLQRIRSNLGALSKNANLSDSVNDLQEALDDATSRNISPQDATALATARQQYRALKQIEPAVDQNGNISPRKLMNSLSTKSNRNQTLYGQGDQSLVNLAKAGRKVLPDTLGNSGTAERFIPSLTLVEALAGGHPIQSATRIAMGIGGVGGAARLMRNQTVVRAATSPAARAVAKGAVKSTPKVAALGAISGVGNIPKDQQ